MRPLFLFLVLLLLSSCGNQREFSGDGRFAKRHYRSGWHIDLGRRDRDTPQEMSTTGQPPELTATAPATESTVPGSLAQVQAFPPDSEPLAAKGDPHEQRHGSHFSGPPATAGQISVPQPVQDEPEPPRKWNWFALVSPVLLIIALVVAIPAQSTELLLVGCLIALAVAYIGARQCRDQDERGAGFAMITLGLAAAGVFIALLALLLRG